MRLVIMTLLFLNRWVEKTLRNEIDEPFHEIQGQIKETLKGILVKELEKANPKLDAKEISSMAEDHVKGRVPKEVAQNMVGRLYAKDEAKKREANEDIDRTIANYATATKK